MEDKICIVALNEERNEPICVVVDDIPMRDILAKGIIIGMDNLHDKTAYVISSNSIYTYSINSDGELETSVEPTKGYVILYVVERGGTHKPYSVLSNSLKNAGVVTGVLAYNNNGTIDFNVGEMFK